MWFFCQIRTLLIVNQSSSIPSIQHKPSLIIGTVFTVQGKEKLDDSTKQTDFNAEGLNTDYSNELSDEADTFISKQRVYSRKFKKRRNLFIADSEESDDDTIKRTK